ncbi:MAG: hypothetical protein V4710_14165 [Verrucomicrobiota bacterium]
MNVLIFTPDGTGHGLYTEVIELSAVGLLIVERATSIEFNDTSQQWEVRMTGGELLFTDLSRTVCQSWEHQFFNQ